MADLTHHRFQIADRSYLNLVKRDIARLAEGYGFSEGEVGRVNIIVSELSTNLIKHAASGGELLVKPIGNPVAGIEIISIDHGPGMKDAKRMMEDGVSTFGSKGEGLGAIQRLAHHFSVYSQVGTGTVLLARFYRDKKAPKSSAKPKQWQVGSVLVAQANETVCGDGFYCREKGNRFHLLAIDGLGHGPGAHEAACTAIEEFKKITQTSPTQILRELHTPLKRTRGCVGMQIMLQTEPRQLIYSGIGNIAGRVLSSEGSKNLISYNGILGHNIPNTIHDQTYPFEQGYTLIVHSDGLKSRWDLNKYPELLRHDPSLIAAVLYKDFGRGTDDTLVAVVKYNVKAEVN